MGRFKRHRIQDSIQHLNDAIVCLKEVRVAIGHEGPNKGEEIQKIQKMMERLDCEQQSLQEIHSSDIDAHVYKPALIHKTLHMPLPEWIMLACSTCMGSFEIEKKTIWDKDYYCVHCGQKYRPLKQEC